MRSVEISLPLCIYTYVHTNIYPYKYTHKVFLQGIHYFICNNIQYQDSIPASTDSWVSLFLLLCLLMKLETHVHLCQSAFQLHFKGNPVFQAKHDPRKNPITEQHKATLIGRGGQGTDARGTARRSGHCHSRVPRLWPGSSQTRCLSRSQTPMWAMGCTQGLSPSAARQPETLLRPQLGGSSVNGKEGRREGRKQDLFLRAEIILLFFILFP